MAALPAGCGGDDVMIIIVIIMLLLLCKTHTHTHTHTPVNEDSPARVRTLSKA